MGKIFASYVEVKGGKKKMMYSAYKKSKKGMMGKNFWSKKGAENWLKKGGKKKNDDK